MTKLSVFLGLFCCVALGEGTGQAPRTNSSFTPAKGQTFYLDLDTAEGAFSEWRHDDLDGLCALHASIRVIRLRNDPKWHPTFYIWVEDNAVEDKKKKVALEIWAKDRKPPLELRIIQFDGPRPTAVQSSNTTLPLDASVPVEIAWVTARSVKIKIGQNETHSIDISWPVEHVIVTASTGEMKIEPLVLGCAHRIGAH